MRQGTRFFILIEPGNGYLVPLLNRRFPDATVIALHIDDSFLVQGRCHSWHPANGNVTSFLESIIPDIEAQFVQIIEWRPACAIYGSRYVNLLSETVAFIKQIDANARTAGVFGRRWVKNFFKNLDCIQTVCTVPRPPGPVIITGAGPSLEKVLPVIQRHHRTGTAFIIAVSSSVPALRAYSIMPDMIIATDGGTWALFHLYECMRGSPSFVLAASMIAALPSQCSTVPVVPITDRSLWQTTILNRLHIPYVSLVQRGTVTASAIDLALCISTGNIGIAGIDLGHSDIRSHARPNAFDRLQEEQASRYNPVYSQRFIRSSAIASGGSLDVYVAWFKQQVSAYPRRLFSLGSNSHVFAGLPAWKEDSNRIESPRLDCRHSAGKSAQGKAVLLQALTDPAVADIFMQDLSPLLFPGAGTVSVKDLSNALQELIP
jgi:hypothetical protein